MNTEEHISRDLLLAYFDGTADGDASRRIETHLPLCERCRNAYVLLSAIEQEMKPALEVHAPEGLTQSVMQRIHPVRNTRMLPRPSITLSHVRYALAFVLSTAIIVILGYFLRAGLAPDKEQQLPEWVQPIKQPAVEIGQYFARTLTDMEQTIRGDISSPILGGMAAAAFLVILDLFFLQPFLRRRGVKTE